MRHNKVNNQKKRYLFNAIVHKWHVKQRQYGVRLKKAVAINTIGAMALMSANVSWAQQEKKTTVLPEVVVTGRQEQDQSYKAEAVSSVKFTEPLRDVPQTVTVVPRSVIQDQGSSSLREVLRNVPGISIQAGEGGVPAGDQMSIRGFSARTDMFVDGVRDFGGYSRDPFNVEQVEVFKGPASSFSGRGSTGGAINQASKLPQLRSFFEGSATYGTDEYKRATFDINQAVTKSPIEGTAVRINGMLHEQDVANRDVVNAERWGIAPSVTVGLGTPTQTTFSYFHLDQNNTPDYGLPWVPTNNTALAGYTDGPVPVPWSNFYGLKARDYEETQTDIFTTEVKHDINDDVSLRNLLRYGRTYRDSVITAPRFVSTGGHAINRQLQSRDMIDTILTNQTDVTFNFNTGDIGHSLVSGVEFNYETSKNHLRTGPTAPVADLYDPDYDAAYAGPITRTGAFNRAASDSAAVYGFDTVKLNEFWEMLGGVRWDYFKTRYESVDTVGVETELDRLDRFFSWRTGLIYKPVENGSIYTAYGTSFNPSAEGLTLASTATATNNINVDPEESRTIELGTKWDLFDERLALSAAIFRTDKTNARTEDPVDATDVIALEGKQRVDGIELGVSGNITDKWEAIAAYTFMKGEVIKSNNFLEAGNETSNTPEHTASIWTTYQLPWNFEIGGGVQFVDVRYSSAVTGSPTSSRKRAPKYWLGDLMLAYHVNENITLRLNANNIADVEYVDRVGGGHFIPGTGRTILLSTDFKF